MCVADHVHVANCIFAMTQVLVNAGTCLFIMRNAFRYITSDALVS